MVFPSEKRMRRPELLTDSVLTTDLRNLALSYLAGGVSLVPCSAETKQPDSDLLPRDEEGKPTWKPYQTEPATRRRLPMV